MRYAAFAVLAVLANLAAQRAVLAFGESAGHFVAAVALGTAVGLVVKYLLDRRWIFGQQSAGFRATGRQFSRYTATGIATTAIFWATETAFWAIWQTHTMREIGAVIGLTIGYVVKYRLDRAFVFTRPGPA
nr:GtrA family protein [Pararhodobacter sp. SW119]